MVFSLKGDQSKQYHGSVDFIDNQVAEGSSTIQMRASVANHEKDLYPGQFGQIQLQLSRQNNVLLVPQAVVKQDIEGSYLFHIAQDNTLQRRNITLGDNFDSWVVVSKGIKEDDRIVSGHLMLMRNGIGVAPQRDDKYPVPKKIKALQKPVPTNTDQAVKQDS